MKKKLYFRQNISLGPITFYIVIDNGKIREFHGFHLLNFMLTGNQPKFETYKFNDSFDLCKLSRYDRNEIKTKANYQIQSQHLNSYLAQDTFIKLNVLDKFIISYSKKDTIFHKMNFTQKLLTLLLITVPGSILIGYLSTCERRAVHKEVYESSTTILHDTVADSASRQIK
ncbi:MAG: hypothetical protein ISS19_00555 [Bacteroidales bacterium]|nr:hypothetical protein [Bacteroidales bacterium]